jgi:hypothetical protein
MSSWRSRRRTGYVPITRALLHTKYFGSQMAVMRPLSASPLSLDSSSTAFLQIVFRSGESGTEGRKIEAQRLRRILSFSRWRSPPSTSFPCGSRPCSPQEPVGSFLALGPAAAPYVQLSERYGRRLCRATSSTRLITASRPPSPSSWRHGRLPLARNRSGGTSRQALLLSILIDSR